MPISAHMVDRGIAPVAMRFYHDIHILVERQQHAAKPGEAMS
jgi:hypothetical protein